MLDGERNAELAGCPVCEISSLRMLRCFVLASHDVVLRIKSGPYVFLTGDLMLYFFDFLFSICSSSFSIAVGPKVQNLVPRHFLPLQL
jgi:hypothetical protein